MAESERVVAIAVRPARMRTAAMSWAAFLRSLRKMAVTKGSSASSTARRKIRMGRTLRISSSGGRVKRSVVEYARGETGKDGTPLQVEGGVDIDELSEEPRKGELDEDAEADAEQAPDEAEDERLHEVDLDDLRGARAKRLHDGDAVHTLLEVRAHGHGDADGTEDESDERHEREETGGAIETLREGGIGLAIVDDLSFRQCFLKLGS